MEEEKVKIEKEDTTKNVVDGPLEQPADSADIKADNTKEIAAKKKKKRNKKIKLPILDLSAANFVPTIQLAFDPVSDPVIITSLPVQPS